MNLTPNQKKEYEQLTTHKSIYVGYAASRSIMNTYKKLVEKGLAVITDQNSFGVTFKVKES